MINQTNRQNLEESAINTNRFKETKRQQMCHTALETTSQTDIKYLENTKTGVQKYYAVDVEPAEESETESSLLHLIVEAFQCPTEPALYLHVNDEEDGLIVWIIMKDRRPIVNLANLNYEVKRVINIDESEYSVLQFGS